MLAAQFAKALEQDGFVSQVQAGSAVGPRVNEFVSQSDGGRVISLSTDHTRGVPGEKEVTLETEVLDEVVGKVVAEGVFGLLAESSGRLIESVDDAATRAQIVDRLTEVLRRFEVSVVGRTGGKASTPSRTLPASSTPTFKPIRT